MTPAGLIKWALRDDPNRLRPFIKSLYADEDKPLKEVVAVIKKAIRSLEAM
jgi:hypothetical protein